MTPSIDGFLLDQKPVFDWNHEPVGTVTTALRDPKTRATKRFTLQLTPEAQARLGTEVLQIELPIAYVFGMRRDGVTLDRSLVELSKSDLLASVLKK